jgi:hypothetical protein
VSGDDGILELAGVEYRISRLNAFDQFDVARAIAPFVPALVPILKAFAAQGDDQQKMDSLIAASQPFLDTLARMPKADSRMVINTCLSVASRRQGNKWSPLMRDEQLMFSDIDLSTVLPLVVRVIRDSLGPFIGGMLTGRSAPEASPKAPR